MIIVIVLVVLMLWFISFMREKPEESKDTGKGNKLSRVLFIIAILFLDVIISFFVFLFVAFGALGVHYAQEKLIPALAIVQIIVVAIISAVRKKLGKKRQIVLTVMCVACIGIIAGFSIYGMYRDSIPQVEEGLRWDMLSKYTPYDENAKTAELEGTSSLRLSENLPRMDGATALYPVYAAFAKAVYPKEAFTGEEDCLNCSSTSMAYKNLLQGEADIIFAAYPSESQLKEAKERGIEYVFTPIGYEAFVFIVNSENTVESLTLDEIKGIYSGQITNWNQVGVNGLGRIRAFQRSKGSGSQTMLEYLMGDVPVMEPKEREDVESSMDGIYKDVADYRNYRNAIGYTFRFYATTMQDGVGIKLLSLNGVAPTEENVRNGSYPLTDYFYAVTRTDASEETLQLLEWIQGEQGQYLVEKTGYTPLK